MKNEYYKEISSEEMFDYEHFYQTIAEEIPDSSFLVELGCWNGRSAIYLATAMRILDKNFRLYMVDNMDYGDSEQFDTIKYHIEKSGMSDYIDLMDFDSKKAADYFGKATVDFVFIDASHKYKDVKNDILAWLPKMKPGSIMAGHDYTNTTTGVAKAVNEVLKKENIKSIATRNNLGVWKYIVPHQ